MSSEPARHTVMLKAAHVSASEVVDELEPTLIEVRRDLHAHPELSWKEERTTERIAETLRDAGRLLDEIVEQVAAPWGVDVELTHIRGVPPVINNERETTLLERAGREVLGSEGLELAPQSMGGEDFAWMTQELPGAMFRLGTKTPGGIDFDLHRGDYVPDERCIGYGTKIMVTTALSAINELRRD